MWGQDSSAVRMPWRGTRPPAAAPLAPARPAGAGGETGDTPEREDTGHPRPAAAAGAARLGAEATAPPLKDRPRYRVIGASVMGLCEKVVLRSINAGPSVY